MDIGFTCADPAQLSFEMLDRLVAAVSEVDTDALSVTLARYIDALAVNTERGALQLRACSGRILASIPMKAQLVVT